jgi:hypothetical protein
MNESLQCSERRLARVAPGVCLKRDLPSGNNQSLWPRFSFSAERRIHAFGGTPRAIPPQAIRL